MQRYEPPLRNPRLPIWALPESAVLHQSRQVWVHVDFAGYRAAYAAAFPEVPLYDLVLDHVLNRRMARAMGFTYLRIVPISPEANLSSGGLPEKWGAAYHATPEMVAANRRRKSFIQYADLEDLVKMLNRTTGGGLQDAVNEAQSLVREATACRAIESRISHGARNRRSAETLWKKGKCVKEENSTLLSNHRSSGGRYRMHPTGSRSTSGAKGPRSVLSGVPQSEPLMPPGRPTNYDAKIARLVKELCKTIVARETARIEASISKHVEALVASKSGVDIEGAHPVQMFAAMVKPAKDAAVAMARKIGRKGRSVASRALQAAKMKAYWAKRKAKEAKAGRGKSMGN